nr:CASP-like protein 4A1 [Penaeus vannamei]
MASTGQGVPGLGLADGSGGWVEGGRGMGILLRHPLPYRPVATLVRECLPPPLPPPCPNALVRALPPLPPPKQPAQSNLHLLPYCGTCLSPGSSPALASISPAITPPLATPARPRSRPHSPAVNPSMRQQSRADASSYAPSTENVAKTNTANKD